MEPQKTKVRQREMAANRNLSRQDSHPAGVNIQLLVRASLRFKAKMRLCCHQPFILRNKFAIRGSSHAPKIAISNAITTERILPESITAPPSYPLAPLHFTVHRLRSVLNLFSKH